MFSLLFLRLQVTDFYLSLSKLVQKLLYGYQKEYESYKLPEIYQIVKTNLQPSRFKAMPMQTCLGGMASPN